jgi:anaerobic selenocysteine-containing dehydrogenase
MQDKRLLIAAMISAGLVLATCAIPTLWWVFYGTVTVVHQPKECPMCTCSCDGNSATLSIDDFPVWRDRGLHE